MERPVPYTLPVMKITASLNMVNEQGRPITYSGIYLYWFVSEDKLTATHSGRMWSIFNVLLHQGILERWAYVSYLIPCLPGQEDMAVESATRLIKASVPDFQLTTGTHPPSVAPANAPAR
jgi:hypothetical protein